MKRYLVTGAAQGIGRAITSALMTNTDYHLTVIDKQKTAFIQDQLERYPDRFDFILQDMAERVQLSQSLTQITNPLDGIINNAAEIYYEKWDDLSLETWDRTLAVNVTAPLQLVHQLRGQLQDGGSVVNIASTDGQYAAFDTLAYAASKAALINLTKSLAAVLGPRGIRVNAIAPGWVETEMTKDTLPTEAKALTPLGRNASAQEVANLVGFLLSADASFISGQTIVLDGGLYAVDYTIWKESQR